MKKKTIIILIVVLIVCASWIGKNAYTSIDGYVVDAETGKPIEGAIVLGWWTISGGPVEMLSGHTYEIRKATTDQSGKFHLSVLILNPFVNEPYLTGYKAGYVCWKSRAIFPDKRREGFKWGSGQIYSLEKFKPEYSYAKHDSFIHTDLPFLDARDSFSKAYEWEGPLMMKELDERAMREKALKGKAAEENK